MMQGSVLMTTGDWQGLLEDIRSKKKKVTIYVIDGTAKIGYILEIQEDYLSLGKKQDSENIDYSIRLSSITQIGFWN